MAKNLIEEFEKMNLVYQEKKEQITKILDEMIELSEETGVPFSVDPFGDFEERAYTPESFDYYKFKESILGKDKGWEAEDAFGEKFYRYAEKEPGWTYWRSSSLTC